MSVAAIGLQAGAYAQCSPAKYSDTAELETV